MSDHVTAMLVEHVRGKVRSVLPEEARAVARHCLLDWFGVALAGSREPLSEILVETLARGDGEATLIGRAERASYLDAALVNGAMSHALDFDDTHTLMSGHPSVPVIPAALAMAEREGADGASLLRAIVAGVEVECRLGALLNPEHYALGFHATGTLGTFGAAAACAELLGLDDEQWLHAMGLAGTQAAGLKSGFGTMAKPLHAGRAAANGALAASLAREGFTGNKAIVETAQGFAATHGTPTLDASRLRELEDQWLICDTLFKYHAACYLTHASIEAARRLRVEGVRAEDVEAVEIQGSAGCIGVCDIAEPSTGLEGKFSLRATVAMALLGDDTSDPAVFTDERMGHADLVSMRDRVAFATVRGRPPTQATVVVRTSDGTREASADVGVPATDLGAQWRALSAKFSALATPVVGHDGASRLHAAIEGIEGQSSVADVLGMVRPVVQV
jgi:2-methylcitrate dehydratase PrpD